MRISFTRTGGLAAAPGLRVHATAVLADTGGDITADGGYRHVLPEEECRRLSQAALQVCAELAARPARGVEKPIPDAFRFRFEIDSGSEIVSLAPGDLPASAAMRVLADWAEAESTRIRAALL